LRVDLRLRRRAQFGDREGADEGELNSLSP
jgi:hypothetical protein